MAKIDFSLVNLGALSKPFTKLIETVGGAAGAMYKPTGTRRRGKAEAEVTVMQARADAEAGLILALGEAAAGEVAGRASFRLAGKELRRQKNIEAITQQALDYLPETVSDEPVDEDWAHQIIEHSQDVGNEQMQSLWAKLLAGEVTKPGSFSLRTLAVVKILGRPDAELFTAICSFIWDEWDSTTMLVVPNSRSWAEDTVIVEGVTYFGILNLDSMGLLNYDLDGDIGFDFSGAEEIQYYGRKYRITSSDLKHIETGDVILTDIGLQLVPIAGGQPNDKCRAAALEYFKKQGFTVTKI